MGPALGAQLPFHFRERIFGLKVGPIFGWDFRVAEPGNMKVYVGPLVSTGYAMTTVTGVNGATGHNWYLTLGGQVRMMFTNRIGAFLRPIDFDVWAGEGGATGFWSLTLGLALSF